MWPNVEINKAQLFPKVAQKVFLKSGVFKNPKKSPYIWANFKRKFDTWILKNVQSGHTGLTNTTMGNCCNPKEEPNEKLPKYFMKKKPKMYFFTCQILPGQDAVGVTTAGCFVGLWTGIERVAADAALALHRPELVLQVHRDRSRDVKRS